MKILISAAQIRKMRKELDCTQKQFGELIGHSWSTIARWESRGGIMGRVPATGKKAEGVRMLNNLGAFIDEMVKGGMRRERRKGFLVEKHHDLFKLAPIEIASIAEKEAMLVLTLLIFKDNAMEKERKSQAR